MFAQKLYKLAIIAALILLVSACTQQKPEFSPQELAEFNLKTNQADLLYSQGNYTSLKEAFDLYESQLAFQAFQKRTRTKLLKTALLLSMRENELSIVEGKHFEKAMDLIQQFPELSDFSPIASVVLYTAPGGSLSLRKDIFGKYDLVESFEWVKKNVISLNADFREKAELDEFFCYFYLTLNTEFPYNLKEEDNFLRFLDIFPDSSLINYKLALFPKFDQERLEYLVQENPEFAECHFHLGNLALNLGKVLTAEKTLNKAYEKIPSSISILKLLTKIHYMLEEFEECLEYNDKILSLTPDYRDALLGKAICLSYLGQFEEAIKILNHLIQMGMYLMGESHYWLAWNLNEMGQLDSALENVKMSLNYLIGHYEVHSLAGIIAFNLEDLDASEEHLKKALWINAGDCEASFYMGKIFGIRENWEQSGIHFENSGLCNTGMEGALIDKIKELEESTLSEARKNKHIARKKLQLRKVRATKSTAFFNAAAGYYNAGLTEKALSLAEKAREHQAIQPKADELIKQIKKILSQASKGNKK